MILDQYIIIKDLKAEQVLLQGNSVESLCKENDYVVERYKHETIGDNIDYKYKIYKNNEIQTFINIGNWKIENLHSESKWVPKILYFDLIDPKGVSSADKTLPYYWINSTSATYIYVNFVGVFGINNLLKLGLEASTHSHWLSFIKARFLANATGKHNIKILNLEKEVDKLKTKLSSIQSILKS